MMASRSVVVLDYGFGNVRSAVRALEKVGADVELTADKTAAENAAGLVIPGVGAFAACAAGVREVGGDEIVARRVAAGRPVLGICVGLQILFGRGVEHGVETEGLGQWPGTVERLDAVPLPHMGWNTVEVPYGSRLFAEVEHERFYFVHSYGVRQWQSAGRRRPGTPLVIWAEHRHDRFIAAIEDDVLAATQFHPEKSGDAGLTLLQNWVKGI